MSASEIKSTWDRAYLAAVNDGCAPDIARTVADFTVAQAKLTEADRIVKVNVEAWQIQQRHRREAREFRANFNSVANAFPSR